MDTTKQSAQLSVLKDGVEIIENFVPPLKVTKIENDKRGWNEYSLTLSYPSNEFTTHIEQSVTNYLENLFQILFTQPGKNLSCGTQ